jgi:hypothetical protein
MEFMDMTGRQTVNLDWRLDGFALFLHRSWIGTE